MANLMSSETLASATTISNLLLLESGQYSDMVLVCGEEQHRVHRSHVCSRSDVIETELDQALKA